MVACVICYVIAKKNKTRQRSSDNMVRARSDQLLHAMLDKSFNNQGICLHQSSIKETCHSKEAGRNPGNQIYSSVDSLSDLESNF